MKIALVKEAIAEAERFIRKAKEVKEPKGCSFGIAERGINSSSCKRASMDLIRCLTRLRQS